MKLPVLAAALMAAAPIASAGTYAVSYEFIDGLGGIETVTATFTADVDTDGNTLINVVNQSLTFSSGEDLFQGAPDFWIPTSDRVEYIPSIFSSSSKILTLDLSEMNYIFCFGSGTICSSHFALQRNILDSQSQMFADLVALPFYLYQPILRSGNDMDRLGITQILATTPIPLPAGLPLAMTGLVGLAALRRRPA
ncbi:VPLPA-CTERM sorting domain-containing protein [Mangrovicoccus sp. HB161399]|uniref:VPLPA-CTERM sorting domain-containing protein n=1 Tax=Mangrovicoccus sp. HB161399 TaxID=2720392 RepID=UPI00155343A2|nr:VPLPA-CTERM sorting domain-containing protein [Mangrovicoccus sp. HB161399]